MRMNSPTSQHVLGSRPGLPVRFAAAADRSDAERSATMETISHAVGRLRTLVDPAQLGPLLHDVLDVVLPASDNSVDATGGAKEIWLGGHAPTGVITRPLHDVLDVVAHELGHVLWYRMVQRPVGDSANRAVERALSESFGDVVGMAVTGFDPRIGEQAGAAPLRTIGSPTDGSTAAARRLLNAPGAQPWDESAGYALGEFTSRAFLLARDAVGDGAALDAWLGAARIHGSRSARLAPDEVIAAFREATVAAAANDRDARAIRDAWSDALAPLT
jgi:hypothetical protein